jgi:hypothetical protein
MTMIVCGKRSVAYLNLAVAVVNASGVPAAADANPVASFYRVDAASGALALDMLVGTSGTITLTPFAGVTGLYHAPVQVSTMLHTQYHVRIAWAVGGNARAELQTVMLLDEFDVISRDRTVPDASTKYTARGV